MPRRTIALSSTSRTRITAMCTPARRAGRYRRPSAARRWGCAAPAARRRLRALGGASRARARLGAGTQTDSTQPSPGADSTHQVAAGQLRALAHAGDAEVAPAGEVVEVVRHLEAVAVVGDREHGAAAERPQPHARPWWRGRGARRCAAPRAGSTRARGRRRRRARPRPRSRARARTPVAADQRSASACSAIGSGSGASPSSARRPVMSSRASLVACRASSASRRASSAAPGRVALDPARERERREPDPRDGLGQRVVHVARQPRALGLGGRQVALLRGQPRLGLGLAVEQPRARPRRPPRRPVQGGLAEVGLEGGRRSSSTPARTEITQ